MKRTGPILILLAIVIALPFLFRQSSVQEGWQEGDPVLIVISPHNEAIRHEFARGFSDWHRANYGTPVKIDWRVIGGTSEIARYLASEFTASMRAWWTGAGRSWPAGATEVVTDRRFDPETPPGDPNAVSAWRKLADIYVTFREVDDPDAVSAGIDVFFGGGEYDHNKAYRQGLTVPPWPNPADAPAFETSHGIPLIPADIAGEIWRTETLFGTAVSTFGICYNIDRLADLSVTVPPSRWSDLADPVYRHQLGVADPTKSGSIAKAFELMIHQACRDAVTKAGFSADEVDGFETRIRAARLPDGELPPEIPPAYQQAVEEGWLDGIRLVQRIGANARYFTDSASKVPIDVSMGNAAAGIAIDFYGRYQAQTSAGPDGRARMGFVTPIGGSGVSCDPISLLRGAPHRELAERFIAFTLLPEGQRLWTYRPGTPGGPDTYALRRIPIRRDFFPSDDPAIQSAHETHAQYAADDLADPMINPYALAESFTYQGRWTGRHFGIQRDIIRAMCMDAGQELRSAWDAVIANGGPQAQPEAMRLLARLPDRPEPLTWSSALSMARQYDRLDYMREWTLFFRKSYREAEAAVIPQVAANGRTP